jgi:hypothetical protein
MAQPGTDTFPEGYDPDNIVGALVRALDGRFGDKYTREQIAHAIAERFGDGDYYAAEDALWSDVGPLLDSMETAVEAHFNPTSPTPTD